MGQLGIYELIVALALAIVGSVPAWIVVFVLRRREPKLVEAYAGMENTISDLSKRLRRMEKDRESDHREIIRLQTVVSDQANGLQVLIRQVIRLGEQPEYAPPPMPKPVNRIDLQRRMVQTFSVDELNNLAFQLNIETGELGEETLSGRARAIINYTDRRGEIHKLIDALTVLRPNETWE